MSPDENIFTRMYPELRIVDRGDVQAEILTQSKHDLWRSPRFWIVRILAFAVFVLLVAAICVYLKKRFGWSAGVVGGIVGTAFPISSTLVYYSLRQKRRRLIREELLRRGYAVCLNCGYDLRAQAVLRCPECGANALVK